jgi:hypothetical protein
VRVRVATRVVEQIGGAAPPIPNPPPGRFKDVRPRNLRP